MKFCTKCGREMSDTDTFCPACGVSCETGEKSPEAHEKMKWYDKFTDWINRMTGGTGAVRPPLKSIFSQIFAKHSKEESEEIFICGTSTTTPELTDNGKAWPKPWLWSRILLVFVITFLSKVAKSIVIPSDYLLSCGIAAYILVTEAESDHVDSHVGR